jgi:arylsulfatase A-like enzyme
LLVRYPELIREPRVVREQVLNIDVAPSIVDICQAGRLPKVQGRSFRNLALGDNSGWRKSWYYEYNYEKEFPYTPNVRGVRTDDWKYIHYPNGDVRPDKYLAELYHLKEDPLEKNNLINVPEAHKKLEELRAELYRLQKETRALPDKMPVNPELRMELPEESIR